MKSPTGPAALPPRLSRLAQQTPGSGAVIAAARDDRLAEAVGSSVSTMDSSYTAEASVSSELSPSGIVTTSPGMPHGVQLPYTISEALPPISPPAPQQQQLPFAAHHTMSPPQQQYQPQPQHQPQYQHQYQLQQHQHPLQPQHQQLTTMQASTLPPPQQPQQPQAWHTSLGPILTTQEPMARAQVAAMAAGGPGPGPSGPGNSTGRSRESSASMWAPPLPIAVGGVASGHGAMRAYGMHSDGAAAAVANAAVAVAGPHAAAVNMPVGPGLHSGGSRGSRGHSRHASYDSIDVNSRDGDGVSQRGNSGGVGGGAAVDARATPFVLYGGGAAATAPPPPAPLQRIAADPTSDLLQQNLQLQRELELLRQQVALFTQVTGLAPATLAAAGMSPTNTHAYSAQHPTMLAPPPQPQQQQQHQQQQISAVAMAGVGGGAGSLPPHPGSVAPQAAALFRNAAGSLAAVAGPGAPPGPMSAPPSSNRHKRSASIDVSSLIATRDGIGPAKDYLAPAASQSPAAASHAPQGHLSPERRSPLARDGGTGTGTGTGNFMMGHKTAPPALEALRQNHPGMSLAQAALAEFEEEVLEEGYDEDDEEPEDDEDGDGGEMEPAVDESLNSAAGIDRLGSVILSVALPLAAQGSLHRQIGEGSGCLESAAGPASGPVPAFPAVQEANGSLAAAAASAGVGGGGGKGGARGGGGAGAPIWRRRNAFVEWANTMHHEMVVEEQPPGGSSASGGGGGGSGSGNGSGSGVPGGGMPGHGNTMAGGAGGTEHTSSSSGYAVPLALAADTLPPEGVQFQYAPGVYITLKPPAQKGGPVRLVKVRFNRKMFTEQSQGQAWWNMHRATLAAMYELTFDMGNKAPVAPSSSPPGLPPLAPGSHGTVPPAAMHTRGMSTDTQGTSAGSTAASGSSSMYFSVPVSNSPLHGGAASGAAGGGDLVTGSAGAMWRSVASAVAGGGGGGGGAGGGGGDFDMSWTELNYDSQAMMVLPPPPPVGTMGVAGSPAMPQRRDHSRKQQPHGQRRLKPCRRIEAALAAVPRVTRVCLAAIWFGGKRLGWRCWCWCWWRWRWRRRRAIIPSDCYRPGDGCCRRSGAAVLSLSPACAVWWRVVWQVAWACMGSRGGENTSGVYITLKPPAQKGGPVRLVKVRFNRKMFTEQSQGQAWWNMHRATLAEMYELTFDMGNKQFGSGESGSASGVGVGGDGGGGGGGPLYPATATALATTAAAAAAQPYYPSHQRAQSGGGSSGRSSRQVLSGMGMHGE
ncbi:hypothetical protein VOLCADRAFT_99805 [Volvox carteri f. nagariensis]|uniref:BRX domain-containing protein n=1 Tax=Volvox carteri f. nagariensis TaxID=3068 RepID=D8UIP6_VOLCA|nr:uncharacterized protein VOLCADRAFT_99805 [Volvox carteri f. nagariensis]EFJ40391.1 hypothetical protein VOLCADRAFT_99805 [Volvox carteri f. nagariensis]|eukprot:XP_002958542.1 hypothetical protein VOLCADRAFT_99805 [Volvox carteri f. nagariensis]